MKETYTAMERDLIGVCLYDNEQIRELQAKLSPIAFADPCYRIMYKCVLDMSDRGEPVDRHTLSLKMAKIDDEHLRDTEIESLYQGMKAPDTWESYAGLLNERFEKTYISKELAKASDRIKSGASIPDTIASVEERIQAASLHTKKPFRPFMEAVRDELTGIGKRSLPDYDLNSFYVPIPFLTMTPFVRGFRYGALSLLGARPSHGKTTFALNCISHAVRSGVKTMMVSIEMTESEIAQKILSMETGIPTNKIVQSSELSEDDMELLADKISESEELYERGMGIDDSSETPSDVMRCIQRAVNDGYKFIIIDHLHELAFDERRSHISLSEEMGNFVKRLRNLAKRHNVAILALCQLNRDVEKRSQKMPVMSDLGETGALERAAFNILFLYRDEVYKPSSPRKGECDVIIAKARDSRTGLITLNFRGDVNQFSDGI